MLRALFELMRNAFPSPPFENPAARVFHRQIATKIAIQRDYRFFSHFRSKNIACSFPASSLMTFSILMTCRDPKPFRKNHDPVFIFKSIRDFSGKSVKRFLFQNRIAIEKRPAGEGCRCKICRDACA